VIFERTGSIDLSQRYYRMLEQIRQEQQRAQLQLEAV
jgi:hypothetical protein